MADTDQDLPGQDTPPTPPPPSPEPSEDWEARFKGLQRKFNAVNAELEQARASLEGARATNTNLQQRVNDLENVRGSEAARYETQITELQAQISGFEQEKSQFQTQVSELQGQVEFAEQDKKVRQAISNPKYNALLPFYEAGHMDGIENLEGEALTQKLESFVQLLGQRQTDAFQQVMQGTVPAMPSMGTASMDEANVDQLQGWLTDPANFSDPQYAHVEDLYLQKVAKQRP